MTFILTLNADQRTTILAIIDLELEKTKKWIKTDPTDDWVSERLINLTVIKNQFMDQHDES